MNVDAKITEIPAIYDPDGLGGVGPMFGQVGFFNKSAGKA
jgi:hypothetical protein